MTTEVVDTTASQEAGTGPVTESFVDRARSLAPLIESEADAIEEGGRLTASVVEAIRDNNLFWVGVPETAGGSGGEVCDAIEVIEELARADASVGWIAMVNISAAAMIAGFLPEDGVRRLYSGTSRALMAGYAAPVGKGRRADGGFEVSGHWTFASGCDWADWFGVGFTVVDEKGKPALDENGQRQALYAVIPRDAARIVRNWDVTGLRGTGSHDLESDGVFVPDSMVLDAYSLTPVRSDAVFHLGKDGIAVAGHAGVALGLMKRALEEVAGITDGKARRGYPVPVADHPVFGFEFAKADAQYRSARAYLMETFRAAQEQAVREQRVDPELRARMRQAAVWAHRVVDDVVGFARLWGGTQAFRNPSVLGRVVRDAAVLTQHLHVDNIWLVDVAPQLLQGAKKN
ncbi:acyl-CoA dehydrogenase family protein [Streptomyces gilvus]|uniref:acyl-CoA dehydrogenase family protein n=1 Tax=Streptomyces gilvus TaxID=2920937 RepID=UPI001F10A98E|nr:acyl-CoA dehydrogenase family protein [Streptomyces sp. CME 23]MCH5677562.1 acyl-CoA dehydrogenase family protein [Streptomyces sp. CME 23]